MAAITYVPSIKGYIADVPRVWFRRCDKRIFYFDEITQANVTPNTEQTPVEAGWSLYPVAYLPGRSTMEISMTSGQFNAEQFALANGRDFAADAEYTTFITEHPEYNATAKTLTLSETPIEDTVSIAGVKCHGDDAEISVSGKVVTITGDGLDLEDGAEVEVSYEYTVADAQVIEIDNKTSAIGEAVFKWPVYGDSQDCTDSAIKGYIVMHLYRCRVTQMPGFDTSYKQVATNSVTWAALDPKRDDDMTYSLAYVPIAEEE